MPRVPHVLRPVRPRAVKVARQFNEDFHTPPIYYLQLPAFAQAVAYYRLGFERQRLKPEVLRRLEE
jgi:hypothetical protein